MRESDLLRALALAIVWVVGACDGGEAVSDVRFEDARQAIDSSDPATVQQRLAGIKGKKVR